LRDVTVVLNFDTMFIVMQMNTTATATALSTRQREAYKPRQ